MDPPSSVATSASDAAALGVQLAQDLYRLASEYPSVECQIGRIAQAFVDLNLTLADLASVLFLFQKPSPSLSQSCLDRVDALVSRINGVQKTFRASLNDDVAASGKASSSALKQTKQPATTTKLGRLKTLFPGSGAAERFTEMEWVRNTLALLAAVCRLSMSHEASQRIVSETLTSAVLIYVRMVEQKLAGPDDDDDDPSDDDEPITGPGSLFFIVPAAPAPKVTAKGKSSLAKKKEPVPPKLDAATWIYEALRDRVKESGRAEELPAQFVGWLLQEVAIAKVEEKTEASETVPGPAEAEPAKDAAEIETAPILEPEPSPAPVYLSKKAAKKAAKLKGKAAAAKAPEPEPEPLSEKTEDNKVAAEAPATAEEAEAEKATATTDEKTVGDVPTANSEPVPEVPAAGPTASPQEPDRPRDSKFAGRLGIDPDLDDLPPPYPSPEAFMPHGRGPPFGGPPYPFPQGNGMPYPPPGAPFDEYSNMAYMQPRPAMFPVGFYPVHPPYMAPQPYFGGRPGGPGPDGYGPNDHYDAQPPTGRPGPGMRRGSIERPGALVPRRRPAGTVLNSAIFGKFDEEEHYDDDAPASRRRNMQSRRRRESDESQKTDDNRENETTDDKADDDKNEKDEDDTANKDKSAAPAPSEMSLERIPYRPKKQVAPSSRPAKKAGKAAAYQVFDDDDVDDGDDKDEDEPRHFSDAETVDIRDVVPSNSGKKRNTKNASAKRTMPASKEYSPPPATVFPEPPSPPTVIENENDNGEGSKSKSKAKKSKAKKAEKKKIEAKADVEKRDDDKGKDKDDSEYESAIENNDNDKHHLSDDNGSEKDDDSETKFSPDTEHRIFTPPATPPHVPPGEAPVPPPAAHIYPGAPGVGAPGAGGAGVFGHAGGPGGMPYFARPPFPQAPQQPLPMMGVHPFLGQRRGATETAAAYGPNVDMGAGVGGAAGAGAAGGAMDPMWAQFWSESMGMPPGAAPWASATTAAATAAGVTGGARAAPTTGAAGVNSSWIRGDNHQYPVNGRLAQQPASRPPLSQPRPAPRPQQWDRYRSRGVHDDEHDDRDGYYIPSEDEDYDDYGPGHGHNHGRDDRDDYNVHPMDRQRPPYGAAQYSAPRRRSRSPPYQPQQRQYHDPSRQPPQQPRQQRYAPNDSPPGAGGWSRDEKTSPPNHHGGPQHPQQQPYSQQQQQQQYRNAYHPYYDQPRRGSFSKGGAEWGWPGDMKQQPSQQQYPQQQQQHHTYSQQTPQMPPSFPHVPPHTSNGHQPAWDDGWNEAYRQSRGHAEFAMTEIDG
ncbi:hypothetical protein SBRCBS47491_001710 [Sporothrix bragantina]|uniref:Uncharacterized protein n=1 Tax=Sporothrix bragantina TaxID=671064 RepID=A0ABP0B0R7_9PEZI